MAGLTIFGVLAFSAWLSDLNSEVTTAFNGKKWAIPAKVYAQAIELYEDQSLSPSVLEFQLRSQGYRSVPRVIDPGTFSRRGNTFDIHVRGFIFPDGAQDAMAIRAKFNIDTLTRLSDINGKPITLARLDPQLMGGIYPQNLEDRMLIQMDKSPETMAKALVVVEDRDFYDHWGVSPKGILRAMLVNMRAGSIVQGGSTLTQQLVKNFYLNNARTLERKIEEAFMALLLEWHYSKEEILETYMNEVYLGQQGERSIHGFSLASQFYFARPLSELSLAKQALLVAIVKGPSYYNPRRFPERAQARRDLVLDMMAEHSIISEQQVTEAKAEPLGIVTSEKLRANAFPAYIDLVKRRLRLEYRNEDLTSEGLRIFTNMNPIVQHQAQKSVSTVVKTLDGGQDNGLEAAMVVVSPRTGEVQAVVGGRDAGVAGFNRALDAVRPIGSLVKPAVYLAALLEQRYTLASILEDKPFTVEDESGKEWTPMNHNKKSNGNVPLYKALAQSYNQATTRLGMDIGLPAVINTLYDLGFEREILSYPSLLLGAIEMNPLEVTGLYQTLASGGYRVPLRAIDAVLDASNEPLTQYSLSIEEALPAAPVELVNFAMEKVTQEGTGRAVYKSLPKEVRVAGKTGTTNDFRDSWFAGYSANTLAVVWLGKDDNSKTRYTGSTGALRIWSDFMKQRSLESLYDPVSGDIAFSAVDTKVGQLTGFGCPGGVPLPFIKGTEPQRSTASCIQPPTQLGQSQAFTQSQPARSKQAEQAPAQPNQPQHPTSAGHQRSGYQESIEDYQRRGSRPNNNNWFRGWWD